VKARQTAIAAPGVEQKVAAENIAFGRAAPTVSHSRVYPDLKANTNFQQAPDRASPTSENKLAAARRFFNNAVQESTTGIQNFPAVPCLPACSASMLRPLSTSARRARRSSRPPQVKFSVPPPEPSPAHGGRAPPGPGGGLELSGMENTPTPLHAHPVEPAALGSVLLAGLFFLVYVLVFAGARSPPRAMSYDAAFDWLFAPRVVDAVKAARFATVGTLIWIWIAYRFIRSMNRRVDPAGHEVTRAESSRALQSASKTLRSRADSECRSSR